MNLYERANQLRKNMTQAEVMLWKHLSNSQLNNYKFRRQAIIKGRYIADFYCPAKKLIIEVDGSIHDIESVKQKDLQRTNELNLDGYQVIRFSNEEVIKGTLYVKTEILRVLETL